MLNFPQLETTSLGRERARHASDEALTLQVCDGCGTPQYPSRSVCGECLSGELSWSAIPAAGRVLSIAVVQASLHPQFRERGPWRICSVVLDAGPRVLAHAADDTIQPGGAVDIHDRHAGETHCVLVAVARQRGEMPSDREQG